MWQLAEAKNKFSELFTRAMTEGPQRVRRRGETVVVALGSRVRATGGQAAEEDVARGISAAGSLTRRCRSRTRPVARARGGLRVILVDTNVRQRDAAPARQLDGSRRMSKRGTATISTSASIVLGEILYGVRRSSSPDRAARACRSSTPGSCELRRSNPPGRPHRLRRLGGELRAGCRQSRAHPAAGRRPDRRHRARARPHALDPQHPRLRRHRRAPLQPLGGLMDFALSEEQVAIRDMARDFGRERIAPLAQDWEAAGTHPARRCCARRPRSASRRCTCPRRWAAPA